MNTLERFNDAYGFRDGIKEFIPSPGEILKYKGENVILLTYNREENGGWKISHSVVKIIKISEYDVMTGTYKLEYSPEGKDNTTEEIRIFPHGFSFENPEETGRSLRFIPFSYHYKFAEFQNFYDRLKNDYDGYKTLSVAELSQISQSKNQSEILEPRFICSIIKMESGEILYFRLNRINLKHRQGKNYALTIGNDKGKTYTFMITSEDTEYKFSYGDVFIGTMKIVDLSDN